MEDDQIDKEQSIGSTFSPTPKILEHSDKREPICEDECKW